MPLIISAPCTSWECSSFWKLPCTFAKESLHSRICAFVIAAFMRIPYSIRERRLDLLLKLYNPTSPTCTLLLLRASNAILGCTRYNSIKKSQHAISSDIARSFPNHEYSTSSQTWYLGFWYQFTTPQLLTWINKDPHTQPGYRRRVALPAGTHHTFLGYSIGVENLRWLESTMLHSHKHKHVKCHATSGHFCLQRMVALSPRVNQKHKKNIQRRFQFLFLFTFVHTLG